MKNPNPNILLRIAQGDAFCAATEYLKDTPRDREVKEAALKFKKFGQHPKHLDLKPGMYTDDTQMSIAVAEVLMVGRPFREIDFADAFVRCFKRDERKGYSGAFQEFLERINSGEEFLANIHPDSDKNGAAMRSVPLGVISDVKELLAVAEMQAKLTHNTPDGILSSQAVALMSHFALYEEEQFMKMPLYLSKNLPAFMKEVEAFRPWMHKPVTGPRVGIKTAIAVLRLMLMCDSLMGILKRVIEWGGDTDSVAAVAWGIASTRMTENVPDFLETNLEDGRKFYGAEFLRKIGASLMQTAV